MREQFKAIKTKGIVSVTVDLSNNLFFFLYEIKLQLISSSCTFIFLFRKY